MELVQFLDDKSLSLIMRKTADNERKAFDILREHYTGKGKPRIIFLYTQLISIKKDENVMDYVIRTETSLTALRNVVQTVNDVLIIAMMLKNLPRHFNLFSIYVTHSNKELMFSKFKTELHSFEETL